MFEVPLNRPQMYTSCPTKRAGSAKTEGCCSAASVAQPVVVFIARSAEITLLNRILWRCHNFAESAMGR